MGSVYKQPEKREDDSCHSWRAQVSGKGYKGVKEEWQGEQGEIEEGVKETRPCIYVNCNLYMKTNRALNDVLPCTYCNNNLIECRLVYDNNPNECHF